MAKLTLADKQDLTELANKLFMYTDARLWDQLLDEVFVEEVWFDMSSLGAGPPQRYAATEICDMWKQGFSGLDAVHHQAGHYLMEARGEEAEIFGYAVASHYKKNAKKGHTRTFTGSYELRARKMPKGWRISKFKYNLKFIDGNAELE